MVYFLKCYSFINQFAVKILEKMQYLTLFCLAVGKSSNADVVCVTESWLNNNIPDDLISIHGYTIHRRDRLDARRGGGLVFFVNNKISCTRPTDLESLKHEAMWLLYRYQRMPRCTTRILIGLVYHPPNGDNYACPSYIIETLDSVFKRHPSAETILLGDFNKLDDRSLLSFPLRQLVNAPARGLSILDKIYSNIHN